MNNHPSKNDCSLHLFKNIIIEITRLSSGYNEEYLFKKNSFSDGDYNRLKKIAALIQLPESGEHGIKHAGKKDFIQRNKYNFLFFDNPYLELLEYLHSNEFTTYQTQQLQLYLGWFSYVDKVSSLFRYLVSTQSLPSDQGKAYQHLSLKAFYYNTEEEKYKEERPNDLQSITDVFYYSQKREQPASVDFVQILRNTTSFFNKRLQFEREKDLIYVPSGEIDACLLCAFFLMQEKQVRKKLIEILYADSSAKVAWENLRAIQLKINWEVLSEIYFGNGYPPAHLPYLRRSYSLPEWLEKFGLLITHEEHSIQLTERGKRMLEWVSLYLSPQKKGVFEGIKYLLERIKSNALRGDYWLNEKSISFINNLSERYGISIDQFNRQIRNFLRAKNNRVAGNQNALDTLRYLLSFLSAWDEKTEDIKSGIQHFQDRCRFDLISHFFLRYIDRFNDHQPDNASRGWIIFPVLRDYGYRQEEELEGGNGRIVGFFLGSIKDSRKDGTGYFENLEIEEIKNEFSKLITEIKTVIKIISRIENREIYYNDIKKQVEQMRIDNDNERIFAHANKYLFGSLAYDAKKIREEIKGTSFFNKTNLPNLVEEYYLKCNLISNNYNRREAMNKGKKEFLNFECVSVELHYFFKYLFVINHFSSVKGSYRLNFQKKQLNMIEKILLLMDFKEFNQLTGDIDQIFKLLFEERNVNIDVQPENVKIKLPIENRELHAHYYFNFLALVNNFFTYWIRENKARESYTFHVIYEQAQERLYFFQSKTGPSFSRKYDFNSYEGDISTYTSNGTDFTWEELKEIGIGIRHVKNFFKQVFNSHFYIYCHKERKRKRIFDEIKDDNENPIVFQYIDNISKKLLTLDP